MNNDQGLRRLAREVKAARVKKFRTVDKARIAAGISRGAWDNVEHGRPAKELTYMAIEDALDWPAGHCLELIAGDVVPGEVVPEDVEASIRASGLPPSAQERLLGVLAEERQRADVERGAG